MLNFILWFSLGLGLQQGNVMVNNNLQCTAPIYAELEVHAESDLLDIYGVYKNEMNTTDTWMFAPYQDYFTVGATVHYGAIGLNVEHQCIHPVKTYNIKDSSLYGGYTKIEIKVTSK